MKKFISILSLCLVLVCGGCSLSNFNSGSNFSKGSVPTTITSKLDTTSENDESLVTTYENCKKSVVTILNYASYYDRGKTVTSLYGSGSGFVYDYDDNYIYLYTNAHVVSVSKGYNQSYYEIVFYDGNRYYGNLAYSNGSEDVAIMKVSRTDQDFAKASIGNSENVKAGSSVFAIGSPLGLEYANTITSGIVSNVNIEVEADDDNDGTKTTMYMIQIDASLNPGNSGGPLFNKNGEVVGVNTLKIMSDSNGNDAETFNFCIPINHFVKVANTLATKGSYSRPLLGVTVIDVKKMSLSDRENYGITTSKGIYIESVSSSGASNGILTKATLISKINDVEINNLADFSTELYKYLAGDSIAITTTNLNGSNASEHTITLK